MPHTKHNEQIKKIMTKDLEILTQKSKISEAAALFRDKGYHHLPVVTGEKLIGMFSFSDYLRLDFSDSLGQDEREVFAMLDSSKEITDVMTKNLKTIKESDTVKEAASLLCEGGFHSLPVVGDNGKLVGLVTATDVMKYYGELS
jgi:CBS domain-containing protein